jgi:predicted Zn finger-like uncharacterized protein
MLTTCPECRTTFRVAHDQLETRRGLVRCGYCRAVFNAYDTLLPELEPPTPAEANEMPPAEVPVQPPDETVEIHPEPARRVPVEVPALEPEPEPQPEPYPAPEPEPFEDPFRVLGGNVPRLGALEELVPEEEEDRPAAEVPLPAFVPPLETPDAILLSELPTRVRIEPGNRLWTTVLFSLVSLVLLTTLVAQAAYFFRGGIVAWQPVLRPFFERACGDLGCDIPLSRDLDALRMESSSLETDPEQPNRARLKVSFSNRSQQVQAWPCFVLRLSDLQGSPLAQRVFWPKDYLPEGKSDKTGMAPMSELEFHLDLDLGGLSAAGYEVKPRYP